MERSWTVKDVDQYFYPRTLRRITKGLPFADEKDPARAYTLSLFLWGEGQNYSGQRVKGVLFRLLMLGFLAGVVGCLFFGKELVVVMQSYGISRSEAFLGSEIFLFCCLLFWNFNAGDAYHSAVKARRVPFQGVRNRIFPLLCSILIPGWGQFANGQPVKGSIFAGFSILGIFSLVTMPAVLFFWPSLETSQSRAIIEAIFAVTALYVPLIPIIWLLSGYDALRVSLDDFKKESFVDRILYGMSLIRMEGWGRSLLPRLKSIMMLSVLLGLLMIVIQRNYIPLAYFSGKLAGIQVWLYKQGMTLVPDLISRLLS